MGLLKIAPLSFLYFFATSLLPFCITCILGTKFIYSDNLLLFYLSALLLFIGLIAIYIAKQIPFKLFLKLISIYIIFEIIFSFFAVSLHWDCYYHDIPYSILDFYPIILLRISVTTIILLIMYILKYLIKRRKAISS